MHSFRKAAMLLFHQYTEGCRLHVLCPALLHHRHQQLFLYLTPVPLLLAFMGPVASVVQNNSGPKILTFHPRAVIFLCDGTLVLLPVASSQDITR